MQYKNFEIIKTGFNEYDVRQNGLTLFEAPTIKDCKKLIEAFIAGEISVDNESDL
jgi:hypothetical protein